MINKEVYIPPTVTVDGVIFQIVDGQLAVLLIQRLAEPFKGEWALPGGYSNAGETTKEALERVLRAKTSLEFSRLNLVEQLYTFDSVARDPRGHAVSVTYMALGTNLQHDIQAGAQHPHFFPMARLPQLAYDHAKIVAYALARLRSQVEYTNIIFALLPATFTLTQLQTAYEVVFGRKLDKRNFRKKFVSFGFLEATGELSQAGAHRPAQLYRFNKQQLAYIDEHFE